MTTKTISPMQTLYAKLHTLGFTKSNVKKLLPEWWEDEIANTDAGFQEASLIISKYLSIRYSSLIGDAEPTFIFPKHKFKHSRNVEEKDLTKAVALSSLAASLTLKAYELDSPNLDELSALTIRETLLSRNVPWIDFNILLDYCWQIGIPVIFVENLPSPKMHGLAMQLNGRPVIILTNKNKYGYLVFHLAHELGHIILGHVNDEEWVIDKTITEGTDDDHEMEANQFALELITGRSDAAYRSENRLYPNTLATSALQVGRANKIDPMHIVLNYGYTVKNMGLATAACKTLIKILSIGESDQEIAKSTFMQYVDVDSLNDEKALRHLIGM